MENEITYVKVEDLKLYPFDSKACVFYPTNRNDFLMDSLREHGWKNPLLITRAGEIVEGGNRWRFARGLWLHGKDKRFEFAPCLFIPKEVEEMEDKEAREEILIKMAIRDNLSQKNDRRYMILNAIALYNVTNKRMNPERAEKIRLAHHYNKEGLSQREISEKMGVSLGTVNSFLKTECSENPDGPSEKSEHDSEARHPFDYDNDYNLRYYHYLYYYAVNGKPPGVKLHSAHKYGIKIDTKHPEYAEKMKQEFPGLGIQEIDRQEKEQLERKKDDEDRYIDEEHEEEIKNTIIKFLNRNGVSCVVKEVEPRIVVFEDSAHHKLNFKMDIESLGFTKESDPMEMITKLANTLERTNNPWMSLQDQMFAIVKRLVETNGSYCDIINVTVEAKATKYTSNTEAGESDEKI